MSVLLGIDLGTSAVKASLLDSQTGTLLAASEQTLEEIPRYIDQPGWCEQSPEDWWDAMVSALGTLPKELLGKVTNVGIAYQMHGLVLLDDDLNPVRRSIIWSDSRAVQSGVALGLELGADFVAKTMNSPGNFTAAKMRWVLDHEPEVMSRAKFALLPGDYLAMRLTGTPTTTSTGVSEMAGWDFGSRAVLGEIFEAASGGKNLLPPLVPIFGDQGRISTEASLLLGIAESAIVSYRAGDQPNNAFSLSVVNSGEVAATAGTSGVLYGVSDDVAVDPLERVNTFLHVNDKFGVLLCVNGAGAFYSWMRRILGAGDFDELNELAGSSPAGANGAFAVPYGNGAERSLGNRFLGASMSAIDLNLHTRGDIARACLESIVFAMRLGFDAMVELGLEPKVVKAGKANMFLSPLFCQVFVDVLGCGLELYNTDGSLGAARGAGYGGKVFADFESAFRGLECVFRYQPQKPGADDYPALYGTWKERLARQST